MNGPCGGGGLGYTDVGLDVWLDIGLIMWSFAFHIIISAKDDVALWVFSARHACDGGEVSCVEGDEAGMTCGHMDACGGGVAFADAEGAVFGSVLGGDMAVAALFFPIGEEAFFAIVRDVLQALDFSLFIEYGQEHAAVCGYFQAIGGDTFTGEVWVSICCTGCVLPDFLCFLCAVCVEGFEVFLTATCVGCGVLGGVLGGIVDGARGGTGGGIGIACARAVILPPERGGGVEVNDVGPVLAIFFASGSTAVEYSVCHEVFWGYESCLCHDVAAVLDEA